MILPLEDTYADVLGKALRGRKLTPEDLALRVDRPPAEIRALLGGEWTESLLRQAARILDLRADSLVALAEKSWRPRPPGFFLGLAEFNSPWHDMTVNSYLLWHEESRQAALFDTGADATGALNFLTAHGLKLEAVFLTHTHGDHIFDLDRVREVTGAPVFTNEKEPLADAESFPAGRRFEFQDWSVDTRLTWGHSAGGTTYVPNGLGARVAVVGDALFAGSMGGAALSYADALRTNREEILSLPPDTILCPGHGPLTTVEQERAFNPFFPGVPGMKPKIGVVGVGRMGANMARRLHEQGFPLAAVYDTRTTAAEQLARELNVPAVATRREVTAAAEVILTVVTDDAAQRALFSGDGDHLLHGADGRLFLNCATVSPQVHVETEALCLAAGAQSLETCMASSIPQARQGSLYLMCAGQRDAYERALPVLEALGSARRYLGPAGTAGRVKALVNLVMNINTAGLAEGLGLGQSLGLDLTMLREVFAETGAASRVLQTDGADMQNREHDCFFSAAHAAKDTRIALDLAAAASLSLPLAEATRDQYERLMALGLGELDKSGVAELTFPGRVVK